MASEYVLTDRTSATDYAVTIDDGVLQYDTTANTPQSEPIFEDDANPGTYWKLYIDNAVLAVENTATVQDDVVELSDSTLGVDWKLYVSDGVLSYMCVDTKNLVCRVTSSVAGTKSLVCRISAIAVDSKNLVCRISTVVTGTKSLTCRTTIIAAGTKNLVCRVSAIVTNTTPLVCTITVRRSLERNLICRLNIWKWDLVSKQSTIWTQITDDVPVVGQVCKSL